MRTAREPMPRDWVTLREAAGKIQEDPALMHDARLRVAHWRTVHEWVRGDLVRYEKTDGGLVLVWWPAIVVFLENRAKERKRQADERAQARREKRTNQTPED